MIMKQIPIYRGEFPARSSGGHRVKKLMKE